MKSILALSACILILSCASKKEMNEWEGLDDFHFVLAACYHPYVDSGYLEPAFSRRGELAEAASKWAGAAVPEAVDSEAIREALKELEQATQSFASLSQSDTAAGEKLTHIHDLFHKLEHHWYETQNH